ncbi:hypothetical protein MKEN_01131500 [Mycena kentingensis (nom. inval.)]|nr:hypothetical protein MKEN_01131500 [Mycena kentingensis (nom. inval.)]
MLDQAKLDLIARPTCTTEQLVGILKALVCGPPSWNRANASGLLERLLYSARIHRPRKLHPHSVFTRRLVFKPANDPVGDIKFATLGGGGNHLFFCTVFNVYCWNLRVNKEVWRYTAIDESVPRICGFFSVLEPGGKTALVVILRSQRSKTQVLRLYLETGTAELLVELELLGHPALYDITHSCGIFCFGIRSHWLYILLDTETMMTCAFFRSSPRSNSTHISLVEKFLVSVEDTGNAHTYLDAIPLATLADHWQHRTNWAQTMSGSITFSALQAARACRVELTTNSRLHSVHLLESPLEEGTYRIWLSTWRSDAKWPYVYEVHSYHFFAGTRSPTFSPRAGLKKSRDSKRSPLQLARYAYGIYYSGHRLVLVEEQRSRHDTRKDYWSITPPVTERRWNRLRAKPSLEFACHLDENRRTKELLPYSGGILFRDSKDIEIDYFA